MGREVVRDPYGASSTTAGATVRSKKTQKAVIVGMAVLLVLPLVAGLVASLGG